MDMERIYRKIAEEEGVSVEKVKKEMQAAINMAYQNPTKQVAAYQAQVKRKGAVPTVDELILHLVDEVKKKEQ